MSFILYFFERSIFNNFSFQFVAPDRYFDEISQDTNKYCYGVELTLRALEMGAVEVVIVWENLDCNRLTLKNPNTDAEKILHLTSYQEKDKSYLLDKETGIEMELTESIPFLEWLANNYKTYGATLEIITDRSQEGSQFVKGFNGIGGILRYRVDLQQIEDADNNADLADDDFDFDYDY